MHRQLRRLMSAVRCRWYERSTSSREAQVVRVGGKQQPRPATPTPPVHHHATFLLMLHHTFLSSAIICYVKILYATDIETFAVCHLCYCPRCYTYMLTMKLVMLILSTYAIHTCCLLCWYVPAGYMLYILYKHKRDGWVKRLHDMLIYMLYMPWVPYVAIHNIHIRVR